MREKINGGRRLLLSGVAGFGLLAAAGPAAAQLKIEISGVGDSQMPIGLQGLSGTREMGTDILSITAADLSRTGAFRIMQSSVEASPDEAQSPDLGLWKERGVNALATGSVKRLSDGSWEVRCRLFDTVNGEELESMHYQAGEAELRLTAHRVADRIYSRLTGYGPAFASRIAYVVQVSKTSYELVVADSDGANATPVLRSHEPIISPAWSPDGRRLAYVSFESRKPVVYIHTLATGERRIAANFRGNNSAPAFSPRDGRLAVALSREGYTQIFFVNEDGTGETRFTRSLAIDTEPAFSPDGSFVYFTSDRGGAPQIYRQPVDGTNAERVTFSASYAVSPSVSSTGTVLAYVSRVNGRFCVSTLDLETGQEDIVSPTRNDESPCFSPNGRIILYATERAGRGMLATVSVDGAVHALLSGTRGDIREPTWGPVF